MPRRLKHTVTHEQSMLVRMPDIVQALLGERFETGRHVQYEIQVRHRGGTSKLSPDGEFLVVQLVREEQPPVEEPAR